MIFELDARPSDSPFVDHLWHARSVHSGVFHSMASSQLMMVVTVRDGKATFTVRGPETRATSLSCDADGEWIGINFQLGVFMPHLPTGALVDRDLSIDGDGMRSFSLDGTTWPFPTYENVDTFVDRLVRTGLLVREPVVEEVLQGRLSAVSTRSVQRRFVQATGLSQSAIRQIERARTAMALLQCGVSILDTVHEAGYYDQPHLTRSLKRLLGQTPAEIVGSAALD